MEGLEGITHKQTLISSFSHTPSSSTHDIIYRPHTLYLHLSRNPKWPSLDCISHSEEALLRSVWNLLLQRNLERENCWITANRDKNMSQQISWTLYLTKKKKHKHCAQDLTQTVYTNPSYQLHTSINPTTGPACAQKRITHLLFTGLHTTRMDGSEKCTNLPTSSRLDELSAQCFEIKQTEWMTWHNRSPEEQRYHRLNGPGACCDRSGRGGGEGSQKKTKKKRTELTPMWISLMESRHIWQGRRRQSLDFSTETVLPHDFASLVVEQNVRRIYWV